MYELGKREPVGWVQLYDDEPKPPLTAEVSSRVVALWQCHYCKNANYPDQLSCPYCGGERRDLETAH